VGLRAGSGHFPGKAGSSDKATWLDPFGLGGLRLRSPEVRSGLIFTIRI
jgi:hypothetical protein